MKSFLSLLCSVFLLPLVVQSVPVIKRASASDWENRVIYQLLTDRFAKSTDDTNGCSNLSDYCGGTFQGIINHLDYIAGMGFDAIWISPIPKNVNGGYHGYWASDFSQINEHFGTADDLKKLVAAAHAKNMYVMLDVVANHAGTPSSGGDYSGYTFGQSSEYHRACDINYNDQNSIEQCWISGLPDINTEDSAIVSKLNSIVSGWVSDYGFDGLRIDTVKHVRKDFWDGYVSAAGVFATGEVLSGDVSYVSPYQQHVPSLINYPLYYPVYDVFTKSRTMSRLSSGFSDIKNGNFKNIDVLVNFIDNHDQPRLLSKADQSLVKNALAYSFMVQGIPVLYYGTEQSFKGGNDPNNREVLWTTGYSTTSDMYKFVTTLVKARKGSNSTVNMGIAQTDNVYVFQRGGSLVVVNNYGQGSTNTITVKAGSFSNGDTLTDVFSNKSVTVQNNQITFQLQNGNPAIFQKN
ncbi:hypothetical protein G6F57_007547 [Rhizopus arrhizus]|uniref:alpha-amylase n=1 Tax=Rhizopus oryzae TaxID=64495 RepID=E2G4G0_RHIOR|nr:a-amylase [Rhizopus arrhizus]KAG1421230.1 hypothetical protein G6F58_003834 [Rhizopus delemar]KAG0937241.1 hypothetical protein G6F30_008392 [Rhizopus arrhizus]KAG0979221.1 hypothetical protein G6F29_008750 [Rhizopus arrhizus]KAG0991876.1 hypothetical protein G6F28_008176 [Rhizopus arrhizus]